MVSCLCSTLQSAYGIRMTVPDIFKYQKFKTNSAEHKRFKDATSHLTLLYKLLVRGLLVIVILAMARLGLPVSTFSSWLTDHQDQRGELPHQSLWKLLKKTQLKKDEEANLSIAIEHRDLLQL
ncbi:hypothetical protein YC2023_077836 [Brassica napus]